MLAGDDPLALATRVPERIKQVHLKDVDTELAARVRKRELSYQYAVRTRLLKAKQPVHNPSPILTPEAEACGVDGT